MEISLEQYNKMAERLTELEYRLAEQPEIIRCKDCEYYEFTEWVAHRCDLLGRSVCGNDYCAWAERKGEQP